MPKAQGGSAAMMSENPRFFIGIPLFIAMVWWCINDYRFLLGAVVLGGTVYGLYRIRRRLRRRHRINKVRERRRIRELLYLQEEERLICEIMKVRWSMQKAGHLGLIERFVERNQEALWKNPVETNFPRNSIEMDFPYSAGDMRKQLSNLYRLIKRKGYAITISEFIWLVNQELKKQVFHNFKAKMLKENPSDLDAFCSCLIRCYGQDYPNYVEFLEKLLKEREIPYDLPEMEKELDLLYRDFSLMDFERQLHVQIGKAPSIEEIDYISGSDFAELFAAIFRKLDFVIKSSRLIGEDQLKMLVQRGESRFVVMCMRNRQPVSGRQVQVMTDSMRRNKANGAVLITNGELSRSARKMTESGGRILLVDGEKLEKLMKRYLETDPSTRIRQQG
ncbi:restriction endonuclease [bacterium]|nr:restriction endonuclease [bacterium]